MTALSPLRTDRITASRAPAILGLSPYQSRADVLREMVRQHFDAPPEFSGNPATQWGSAHEADALAEYEFLHGVDVRSRQEFVIHPDHPWLGCSLDGRVGTDGLAEAKAPWRATYSHITERPDYRVQIQLQMACTQASWCDFIVWRQDAPLAVSREMFDPDWLPSVLPRLEKFLADYAAALTKPDEYLADKPTADERTDDEWLLAALTLREAKIRKDIATQAFDDAHEAVLALAGGKPSAGFGVSVGVSERKGAVEYAQAIAKHAPDVDLEDFRKPSTTVYTVRVA